jgi:hypothetical protein
MKKVIHKQVGFCFIILFMLIIMKPVSAQTPQMVVHKSDGTTVVIPIPDIRELTFSGVVGIDNLKMLASAFRFFEFLKSYPNPLKTETHIDYRLDQPGRVRILIYNQQGVLIRELLNQDQPVGDHSIPWNANGTTGAKVKPGIYLCTVQFKNQIHSERIIVID